MNIEQGHAILAGHSFEHELALAASLGLFGSIDMNRNDYQSGWDTDQFPDSVPEMARAFYEVLRAGGFTTGGTNFDAKIRRQSLDPEDLILAHVGAMDVCARALKAAAALLEDGALERARVCTLCGLGPAKESGASFVLTRNNFGPCAGVKTLIQPRFPVDRSGWKTSGIVLSDFRHRFTRRAPCTNKAAISGDLICLTCLFCYVQSAGILLKTWKLCELARN